MLLAMSSEDMESGIGESGYTSMDNLTEIFENNTLTCAARNIQGPVISLFSPAVDAIIKSALGIFYVLLLVFGTFLNSMVIALVAKFKKLQTLSFCIAIQVSILDLVIACVMCLPALANIIANKWLFGEHMCAFIGFANFFLSYKDNIDVHLSDGSISVSVYSFLLSKV